MLINHDFPQLEPKSPVKRRLELVGNANQSGDKEHEFSDFNRATKLLQETIVKIEGAYAPDLSGFIGPISSRNSGSRY
jgi:hypothetical protein